MSEENIRAWSNNEWMDLEFDELSVDDLVELEAYVKEEMIDIQNQIARRNLKPKTQWTHPDYKWETAASTMYKRKANRLAQLQQVRASKKKEIAKVQHKDFLSNFHNAARLHLEKSIYLELSEKAKTLME